MWYLGLRPRNSFSENICFEFSVLCLCSVRDCLLRLSDFPVGGTVRTAYTVSWRLRIFNCIEEVVGAQDLGYTFAYMMYSYGAE